MRSNCISIAFTLQCNISTALSFVFSGCVEWRCLQIGLIPLITTEHRIDHLHQSPSNIGQIPRIIMKFCPHRWKRVGWGRRKKWLESVCERKNRLIAKNCLDFSLFFAFEWHIGNVYPFSFGCDGLAAPFEIFRRTMGNEAVKK